MNSRPRMDLLPLGSQEHTLLGPRTAPLGSALPGTRSSSSTGSTMDNTVSETARFYSRSRTARHGLAHQSPDTNSTYLRRCLWRLRTLSGTANGPTDLQSLAMTHDGTRFLVWTTAQSLKTEAEQHSPYQRTGHDFTKPVPCFKG